MTKPNTISSFLERIKKTRTCWLWLGSKNQTGYGMIKVHGHNQVVHRVSYEFHFGRIPKGMKVLHKCDVRECVNPKHLFIGTQLDNVRDMFKKGRERKANGERNGASKLTDQQVREIRKIWITLPKRSKLHGKATLAKKYGVGRDILWKIVTGRSWKNIV